MNEKKPHHKNHMNEIINYLNPYSKPQESKNVLNSHYQLTIENQTKIQLS